jgi:uncharacterized protein (DUF486 family)
LALKKADVFMTFAWYGHLKYTSISIWTVIAISRGIAFFEYCLMVPANRYGFIAGMNGFQLKIIPESDNAGCICSFCNIVFKSTISLEIPGKLCI